MPLKEKNTGTVPVINLSMVKILQISAFTLVGIILIITISVFIFNIMLKKNLETELTQGGANSELIYQEQLAQFLQKLKELKPEERNLIRNYIIQYNTLLLNEIDQLAAIPGEE